MRQEVLSIGSLPVLTVLAVAPLAAQAGAPMPKGPELPMHPQYERGQPVSPIFEGWYENPDGTYTLSFGYFNRNSEEVLEIPIGPDNFVEPAEFDGNQPTTFQAGRSFDARGWGLFNVVLPATATRDDVVVWTLTSKGRTHSVPGKIGVPAYQLMPVDQPAGVGAMAPRIRFGGGPEVVGRIGAWAPQALSARVGEPIAVSVWAQDNYDSSLRDAAPVQLSWSKYQGPPEGTVEFTNPDPPPANPPAGSGGPGGRRGPPPLLAPAEGGEVSTQATFSAPGEYVLRVEAMAAGRDSSRPDQCCWTNGYVRVNVAE